MPLIKINIKLLFKKYIAGALILLALCQLTACYFRPPSARELPHPLQGKIYYINQQPNSSLDSQITSFFNSIHISFTDNIDQASAEIRILGNQLTNNAPSTVNTTESTTITYTETISYQVTNLKNGNIFGPTTISSSASNIIAPNQVYNATGLLTLTGRLQYNCVLQLYNQLSSESAHSALTQIKKKYMKRTRNNKQNHPSITGHGNITHGNKVQPT